MRLYLKKAGFVSRNIALKFTLTPLHPTFSVNFAHFYILSSFAWDWDKAQGLDSPADMRSYASRTLHVEALDVYMGSNGMNSFQRVVFVNEMLRNTNLYRKRRWSVNGRVFLSCSSTRLCEGQNCLASGNRR